MSATHCPLIVTFPQVSTDLRHDAAHAAVGCGCKASKRLSEAAGPAGNPSLPTHPDAHHAHPAYSRGRCATCVLRRATSEVSFRHLRIVVTFASPRRCTGNSKCRRRWARVRREHRLNPLDEPMKVRARSIRHAYFLPPHHQVGPRCARGFASSASRSHAMGASCGRYSRLWRCSSSPPTRGRRGVALGASGRCAAGASARTRAPSASSCMLLTPRLPRSVAAGTSMGVAERASGRGPTASVAGVAAAAAAAAAALCAARGRTLRGFRRATWALAAGDRTEGRRPWVRPRTAP